MGFFEKFDLRDMEKSGQVDLAEKRREKLLVAIEVQKLALAAALADDTIAKIGNRNDRAVRRWFKSRDNGYYVQCFYGPYALQLDGEMNALFVDDLRDVGEALVAFEAAARSGALDHAIEAVVLRMTERSAQTRYQYDGSNALPRSYAA